MPRRTITDDEIIDRLQKYREDDYGHLTLSDELNMYHGLCWELRRYYTQYVYKKSWRIVDKLRDGDQVDKEICKRIIKLHYVMTRAFADLVSLIEQSGERPQGYEEDGEEEDYVEPYDIYIGHKHYRRRKN